MSYIGSFLGRLPAPPARMEPRQAMPQGRVGLQSAPPRPPGHPSSLASVQPGPAGTREPIDPNMLVPAIGSLLAAEQPRPEPSGEPYVPLPPPPNGEGSPGWLGKPPPPQGGVVGPTAPGGQPNPGNGYGGLYPPGTIGNSRPLSPLEKFLLARAPHAV